MSHRHHGTTELEERMTMGDQWVQPGPPRGDDCQDCASRRTCVIARPRPGDRCPHRVEPSWADELARDERGSGRRR